MPQVRCAHQHQHRLLRFPTALRCLQHSAAAVQRGCRAYLGWLCVLVLPTTVLRYTTGSYGCTLVLVTFTTKRCLPAYYLHLPHTLPRIATWLRFCRFPSTVLRTFLRQFARHVPAPGGLHHCVLPASSRAPAYIPYLIVQHSCGYHSPLLVRSAALPYRFTPVHRSPPRRPHIFGCIHAHFTVLYAFCTHTHLHCTFYIFSVTWFIPF